MRPQKTLQQEPWYQDAGAAVVAAHKKQMLCASIFLLTVALPVNVAAGFYLDESKVFSACAILGTIVVTFGWRYCFALERRVREGAYGSSEEEYEKLREARQNLLVRAH